MKSTRSWREVLLAELQKQIPATGLSTLQIQIIPPGPVIDATTLAVQDRLIFDITKQPVSVEVEYGL